MDVVEQWGKLQLSRTLVKAKYLLVEIMNEFALGQGWEKGFSGNNGVACIWTGLVQMAGVEKVGKTGNGQG